jgi:hypothetical protein
MVKAVLLTSFIVVLDALLARTKTEEEAKAGTVQA